MTLKVIFRTFPRIFYTRCSTTLSAGGIRQQFTNAENIQMSMYGSEFLHNIKEHLCVADEDPPNVQFNENGYLFLATENGAHILEENSKLQKELGAKVELLSPTQLKARHPWLNTSDIALASYGFQNEGWFDPWSLLSAFRKKATSLGARYIDGEVTGFDFSHVSPSECNSYGGCGRRVKGVQVAMLNSPEVNTVNCSYVIVAAGASSKEVGMMADIGLGTAEDQLDLPIPVEPRKRYIYVCHAPDGPLLDCPFVIQPDGSYFRREGLGGMYIMGKSPTEEQEPNCDKLTVDYDFFDEEIWPFVAHRAKAFENLKMKSAWAGYYDFNTFDQNGIIGYHPAYPNLLVATGFSGHGIQQSPAVGQAITELLLNNCTVSIDLSRMGFDRFRNNTPLLEKNII
ncbi:FAD-dependent oxidoreductase domain-containing protein 1-like isoform X2 [Anneissia japonica]|uniref:FAD-dependent oxidoreductase domain-containing protein 1-like isoform X2 n=1 Tax=Anneissia japonica TaxID=1529436 RepID=UPI0014254CEC|nr:FAD-dependent oxidoreductase domain-containing protein 1-like isoform X2 [Anneissia japonica]